MVVGKLVPVFTSVELSRLERACQGLAFAQRRDHAIISVFRAIGIRLSELAGIRYDPDDPQRSDVDLWRREIRVRGKGGQPRVVRISHETARDLDRYIRARPTGRSSGWGGNRAPMTANGIYQMVHSGPCRRCHNSVITAGLSWQSHNRMPGPPRRRTSRLRGRPRGGRVGCRGC
jgi:site-specific recombinase XerD